MTSGDNILSRSHVNLAFGSTYRGDNPMISEKKYLMPF